MRGWRRLARYAAVAAVGAALIAAGAGPDAEHPPRPPLPRVGQSGAMLASDASRLAVIVMENKEYSEVIGNRSAPYVNRLARRYGLATRLYAVAHPSLPNYLALTAGSTFGIHSDCIACRVTGTNLVDQLGAAGIGWRAYIGGISRPCFAGDSGPWYRKAINPFAYLADVAGRPARCARVVPGARLPSDLRRGRLAPFSWISPNLCDDGHSCGARRADRYLARIVPPLLRDLGPHGLLIVTWDEGRSARGCCGVTAGGGHVPLILAGPDVRPHSVSRAPISHYAVLRTVEAAFGLPPLRRAATARRDPLTDLLAVGPNLLHMPKQIRPS